MFLDNHKVNESCTILDVPEQVLLKAIGIRKGIMVRIVARQPMGGPVVVKSGGNCIAIDINLAKAIRTAGTA